MASSSRKRQLPLIVDLDDVNLDAAININPQTTFTRTDTEEMASSSNRQRPLVVGLNHDSDEDGLYLGMNDDEDNDEATDLEELEEFARVFKQKRIKIGFTQGDVGLAVGRLHGADFSQTTISRFEALNLSFKNMCKLKPLLEQWLHQTEDAISKGTYIPPDFSQYGYGLSQSKETAALARKRRKRTHLDARQRNALVSYYQMNPRPDNNEIARLGDKLNLDKEVVRVWFCNRRQKERKEEGTHPTPNSPARNLGLMLFTSDSRHHRTPIPAYANVQVGSIAELDVENDGSPLTPQSAAPCEENENDGGD
uniref:POU domain protein n=1 Tax=Plectus sambesii TaxID=2011161 RepID=A0A914WF45_9BILA